MIKVYEATERLFSNNGLKILHPLKAVIYIEDNGDYYLDLETTLEDAEYIQEGNIIRANTRWGEQGFRLTNPQKKNNRITVRGYHLWKDSSKYVIVNSYVENKDCNDALDHLNSACDLITPFTTISDINTLNSIRIVRKSFEETIALLIERWGGHLYRDNWQIGIKETIGMDRGAVIKYGKNSQNIEADENWDDVVTKILPVGYDGITLPEVYLQADIQYDVPYTKVIKFDQDIDQEDFKDEDGNVDEEAYHEALIDDLRTQATAYLEENKYFKCNYKVKAELDGVVDLGDTIVVNHEKLGIHITTNVIALKYDCIRDKYIEIEFGNFRSKLKDLFKNRYMLFAWMSAGVGFMQYFLFSEEGARDMDANFSWGYAFTIILIFGISLILWMEDVKKFKTFGLLSRIYLTVSGIVLLYHTYCGILFFERIVRGVSYMMWG